MPRVVTFAFNWMVVAVKVSVAEPDVALMADRMLIMPVPEVPDTEFDPIELLAFAVLIATLIDALRAVLI